MPNYLPANYSYEEEIAQSELDGHAVAVAAHTTTNATGTDRDGADTGYNLGYHAAAADHTIPALNFDDALGNTSGFEAGYTTASTFHTTTTVSGTDLTGAGRGYHLGYEAASVYHTTNTVSGTDSVGRQRGYHEGYEDARDFHIANTVSGNDATGTERGYFEGYKDARDFHVANTVSGNDATGIERGYYEGYKAARDFHTTADADTTPDDDSTGTPRGYSEGYVSVGRWALRMPANQSLNANVYTKVNFNTTSATVIGATHNTGTDRITITQAGTYEIAAGWEMTSSGRDAMIAEASACLYKNGSLIRRGDSQLRSQGNEYVMCAVREELTLAVGDYIQAYAWCSGTGGTRTIEQVSADSTDAFFIGFKQT
jgi:hypothetical protein